MDGTWQEDNIAQPGSNIPSHSSSGSNLPSPFSSAGRHNNFGNTSGMPTNFSAKVSQHMAQHHQRPQQVQQPTQNSLLNRPHIVVPPPLQNLSTQSQPRQTSSTQFRKRKPVRRRRSRGKDYPCPKDGYLFTGQQGVLIDHARSCGDGFDKPFLCSRCNKGFYTPTLRNNHEKKCKGKNVNPDKI